MEDHLQFLLIASCYIMLCYETVSQKHTEDDLDFSSFINCVGVDSDGYQMLADVATALTNCLFSFPNHLTAAYIGYFQLYRQNYKTGKYREAVVLARISLLDRNMICFFISFLRLHPCDI